MAETSSAGNTGNAPRTEMPGLLASTPILPTFVRGTPPRDEYKNDEAGQKAWRLDVFKRYLGRVTTKMWHKQKLQQTAIDMYLATTDSQNIPSYAMLPGSDGTATSSMPYEFLNPLFAPIKKRVGAFSAQEIEINADVVNEGAKSRKEEFYLNAMLSKAMGAAQPAAEAFLGPLPNPQAEIENQGFVGTVEDYMNEGYKDIWENVAERLMRDWMSRQHFKATLDQIYLYYALTQTAIFFPRVDRASLETELYVEDPAMCIWDMDMQDDYGRDMQWFVRYRWLSEEEILRRYPKATREEIREIGRNAGFSMPYNQYWPLTRKWDVDQTEYYLVAEMRWIYTEKVSIAEAKATINHTAEEEYETEDAETEIPFQQVYYTVLIGNNYELEGGVLPNQVRSVDVFAKANLGIFVLSLGHSLSPFAPTNIARVESLVRMRNMLFYKATSLIADAKGIVLDVDRSVIPTDGQGNASVKEFLTNLLGNKIIVRDSTEASYSMDAASIRAQSMVNLLEVGVPKGLGDIVSMINMVTAEMNSILSLTDASQGNVGQYQNAATAQINLSAYQAAQEQEDKPFRRMVETVLTYVANQEKQLKSIKMARANEFDNEEAADAIQIRDGDEVLMLDPNGFIFQDIGIRIAIRENTAEQQQLFDTALQAGLQQGSVSFQEYIIFKSSDNLQEGIRSLKNHYARKEREAKKAQEAQAQQESQMMQMQAQMQAQQEKMKEIDRLQADLAKEKQAKDLEARNSNINSANNFKIQEANQKANLEAELVKEANTDRIPQQ